MLAPRVVLDTNVVLSALLFRHGRLSALRLAWQGGRCVPVVCAETLSELTRILGYAKFRLTEDDVRAALALYLPYVEACPLPPAQHRDVAHMPACRDPKDQIFLELAFHAKARLLLPGGGVLRIRPEPAKPPLKLSIPPPLDFLNALNLPASP